MSNSGVGRGRGWLNLNKNVTPGGLGISQTNPVPISKLALEDDSQFEDPTNEFTDLINKVKQLNVNDDGIKFNQKIKYILDNWKEYCQTSEDVEHSFDVLYDECLKDANLASKVVVMISSRSFISQEVHNQNIRLMFLRKLQNNFEGAKNLQKVNPTSFRNSVQMLGEFYNKARLASGLQLTFMATPFISYLEMLLESAQPQDLKLFTTQLYLNGTSVKEECPDKILEILNNVRLLLTSDKQLPRESKLWLLLSLDVATNKFGFLPCEIHKFYQDHLGEIAMANFQSAYGTLSVKTTQESKTLDNYQSKVNVLQVSTSSDSISNHISSQTTQPDLNTSQSSSGFGSDSSGQNSSPHPNRETGNTSGKHGRPILGVGARFNKSKSNDDTVPNWRDKDHSGGWSDKQKSKGNWNDSKKTTTKSGKGWEHDDRFDTDYS